MGDPYLSAHLPEVGDSCLKAHLHLSVQVEVVVRRGRGTEQRDQGRGTKVLCVQMSTVHSNKASDGPLCIILVWSCQPNVILASLLEVANLLELGWLRVRFCIF